MNGFDLSAWWAPLLAFAAGVVAFASPCVLPLVPGYLSFIGATGPSPADRRQRGHLAPMVLFVLGFSVVFTVLGAFAGVLVPVFRSTAGQRVAGAIIVVVGALLLAEAFGRGSSGILAERRPLLERVRPGPATAFPLGMAFAAGWTPCIGPVLAGILTLASTQGTSARAALLLFAFSLGLGLPFIAVGLGVGGLLRRFDVLRRNHRRVTAASGTILVAVGLLLVTGLWSEALAPLVRVVNSFEPPI